MFISGTDSQTRIRAKFVIDGNEKGENVQDSEKKSLLVRLIVEKVPWSSQPYNRLPMRCPLNAPRAAKRAGGKSIYAHSQILASYLA